jgi:ABC-type sugar transport system ATPase subunit
VKEAADILGIGELLDRKPKQLSGGQRQRVAVGRAIVRDPAVFCMDEPLSNLDAKLRVQARAEISKLHQSLETTFIYVTHDQVEAMTMGTRIAVMRDGILQQVDTPKSLYDAPQNVFVAGRCLVSTARIAGREVMLVQLGSKSKYIWGDAERMMRWGAEQSQRYGAAAPTYATRGGGAGAPVVY